MGYSVLSQLADIQKDRTHQLWACFLICKIINTTLHRLTYWFHFLQAAAGSYALLCALGKLKGVNGSGIAITRVVVFYST